MRPLAVLATLAALAPLHAADSKTPPNIVILLADDMGWADIGCYGSEIPTPNLDGLAATGVRFSQFYNTARCSPTRASLLTGHYPHQAGMGHLDGMVRPDSLGYHGRLNDSSVTIAEVLGQAGYLTAMCGKWHAGQNNGTPPWVRGFQRSLNSVAGGIYFPGQSGKRGNAELFLNGRSLPLDDPHFGTDWYSTNLWTDWGIKFIDEALAAKQPFFLYLPFCCPHFPLMAPAEDIARHRGKYRAGWDALREQRLKKQTALGLIKPEWALSPREDSVKAWNSLSPQEQDRFDHIMAVYAAMVEVMDRNIGRLVAALRERGQFDNTLLLFLSDNGGNAESGPNGRYEGDSPGGPRSDVFVGQSWATLNNTPFRKFKHYVHEGGISTPLIAHWPAGIPASRHGSIEPQPGHLVDLMATAVAASGAAYPAQFNGHAIEPMEGTSLLPALRGEPLHRTNPLLFEHEGNRALREGHWKIVSLHGQPWELYDMEADRTELHNLAAQQPERVKAMAEQYETMAQRCRIDPWDTVNNKKNGSGSATGKKKKKKSAPPG